MLSLTVKWLVCSLHSRLSEEISGLKTLPGLLLLPLLHWQLELPQSRDSLELEFYPALVPGPARHQADQRLMENQRLLFLLEQNLLNQQLHRK